ncbi:MAG: acylphosphatase [Proteobacteria bacterium]|nr:acylphosphatase [Pseudomonadota bacterium]
MKRANPSPGNDGVKRVARRVVVVGRVQGVWFRESTRQRATALGIDGWVRNRFDGSVEALFEGQAAAVEEMLAFVREGPPAARVTSVDVQEQEPSSSRAGFAIRRDDTGSGAG